ncbi:MAG: hypothetical protein LBI81_01410 [Puniceicoccales bacterium]|jgi:hypothetical protein|nr:hypothetical protein [Puniceicoccales bacterium]
MPWRILRTHSHSLSKTPTKKLQMVLGEAFGQLDGPAPSELGTKLRSAPSADTDPSLGTHPIPVKKSVNAEKSSKKSARHRQLERSQTVLQSTLKRHLPGQSRELPLSRLKARKRAEKSQLPEEKFHSTPVSPATKNPDATPFRKVANKASGNIDLSRLDDYGTIFNSKKATGV